MMYKQLQKNHVPRFSTSVRLILFAGATFACTVFTGPIHAATELKPAPDDTA